MKIHKITFKNYRCFLNDEIDFPTTQKKNMVVLVGPNGGGKTETLFAFWWTLYDFDFSKLINKENTPYALNSGLYRELEASPVGTEYECSVSLEFEENNTTYIVRKWCKFRKAEKTIKDEEFRELSFYNSKGELSLPIRDSEEINKRLNRIIPKTILYGIIFDGERMQKLNAPDEKSVNAIRGVISDITNRELIENCNEHFRSIKSKLNKELNIQGKKKGNYTIEQIITEEEEKEELKKELESSLKSYNKELSQIDNRLSTISDLLQHIDEVKQYEQERQAQRREQISKETDLEGYYKNFSASLRDGYLIASQKLLNDVETIIQKYDIPQDLTVPAVRSILSRKKCICGREIDECSAKTLNSLIEMLPPDNINSTLSEYVRSTRQRIIDVKEQTKQNYDLIRKCEKEINEHKKNIASLKTRIISLDENGENAAEAIKLENENQQLLKRKGFLETIIPEQEERIKQLKKEIEELRTQRDASIGSAERSLVIQRQITFVEKCTKALERIKDVNKETALNEINERLSAAYELLSEDSERGRKIRIIQYDSHHQYQIAVYMEKVYKEVLKRWHHNGDYQKKLEYGMSEEQIEEEAIINCMDPNSTGQSKINTFAFVKAILEYSSSVKDDDGIAVKKEYPLLIDSPFGDISAGNLSRSSTELHNFANQVILMIDDDKYKALKSVFVPYTAKEYRFAKADNDNYSSIT